MSIVKNEIPILEFDTEQSAVLNPTHENLGLKLPKKCVFAFLGAYIDEYANKTNTKQVSTFVSATKDYPIYITKYEGEEIVLCQAPVGSAPATQLLDWLIGYGVREIISAGSCGALEKFPESTFLVPSKALRDEGTSYHYAPPSRFMEISEKARKAIEDTILRHGMKYQEVHLDVIDNNEAAKKFYKNAGFQYICTQNIFYEVVGNRSFEMYEYVIY